MSVPSDRDLIQRARRGETEAFGELVTRYQTSVFNVCYRILHERAEAEDMAQESFIRAHERLSVHSMRNAPLAHGCDDWRRMSASIICHRRKLPLNSTMSGTLMQVKDLRQFKKPANEVSRSVRRSRHCL